MIKEFHITDTAIVDGKPWYSIIAGRESSAWLRTQPPTECACTFGKSVINLFDVTEDLLVVMKLKWPL
jgi:hypothetical protein